MKKQQIFLPALLSVVGLVVWILVSQVAHQKEAWDSSYYFTIGLPVIFAASAVAGYIEPKRPWRWGLFIFLLQPVALFYTEPGRTIGCCGTFLFSAVCGSGSGLCLYRQNYPPDG